MHHRLAALIVAAFLPTAGFAQTPDWPKADDWPRINNEFPPFSATRQYGCVYGRGTIDDKSDVLAALMTMLMLKRSHIALHRDVIFVSEAGEEAATEPGIEYLVDQHWDKIEAEICIAEISWAFPTVTLNYPSNIPGGPGHNWANGVAMATPIAHKGVIAGAKVQAMTMLDILMKPDLVQKAWDYYNNVQAKETKYKSLLRPDDKPAIWLNQKTMEEYRPRMKAYYYDPSRFDTYLDQLGIKYPTVRTAPPQ